MARNLLVATLVATFSIGFVFGCSDDEAAAPDPGARPDPTVGPAPPTAPPPPSALPQLNLPIDGAAPPPADAGPDIQPVDNDPGPGSGALVFAVDVDGRLISFRSTQPNLISVRNVTGLQPNEKIVGIDFRPANGQLYGVGTSSRLYTLNRATGAATVVGDGAPFSPLLQGQAHGFDVNPVADKIRIHTDVDQNLRLDPVTGKVTANDGVLAFAAGDVNFGQSPNIVGTAYTNSVSPAPATTTLYGIDSTRNLVVTLANPNDGQITSAGTVALDIDEVAGFDIVGPTNVAYAVLRVNKEVGLYTIDLATHLPTKLGVVTHPIAIAGIAVEP